MAIGGAGVARSDGLVFFVDFVAPGDRVACEVTLVKKRFAEARLIEVLAPGPSRISPPCPYAGVCGGCSWQQIEYAEQLAQKRSLIESALHKQSGFTNAIVPAVLPSPREFRYRNRVQVHVGASSGEVGFRARRSGRIVDVEDCLIAEIPIARELAALRGEPRSALGRLELRRLPSGEVRRGVADDSEDGPGFGQVNEPQNQNLVERVTDRFREFAVGQIDLVWDLYAGSGNFTFPLAAAFPNARISAVEWSAGAARAGSERAQAEGLGARVAFARDRVENWIASATPDRSIAVLLDPPRVGCDPKLVAALARMPLAFVGYVSCHPATLARDLRAFANAGWELAALDAFDMFPQTDHVETIAWLRPPKV